MATTETLAPETAAPEAPKKRTYTKKAPAVKAEKLSGMVTVCLRNPYNLIFEINGRKVVIKGHNARLRGLDGGVLDSGRAFGETVIPASDWKAIQEKYGKDRNDRLFSGGFIFAAADKTDARAEAKEKEGLKTGLEPVDPKKTAIDSGK